MSAIVIPLSSKRAYQDTSEMSPSGLVVRSMAWTSMFESLRLDRCGGRPRGETLLRQMCLDVSCDQSINVQLSPVSFVNTVGTVRVFHEIETLTQLHQTVDQLLIALEMHVVITSTVNDEQFAL